MTVPVDPVAPDKAEQSQRLEQFEFGSLEAVLRRQKRHDQYDVCLLQGQRNYLAHQKQAVEAIRQKSDQNKPVEEDIRAFERRLQQEVRALIARWLRMQNVCVLAGAGTSVKSGGPLGADLAKKVSKLLDGRPSSALFEKLREACKSDLNFEAFLSHLGAIRRCLDPSAGGFTVAFPARANCNLR